MQGKKLINIFKCINPQQITAHIILHGCSKTKKQTFTKETSQKFMTAIKNTLKTPISV